jgi:osmotically-inducible protein OsmY
MTRTAVKSDSRIHHDVIEELKWDTRVDETDVGVEVDDGVVTLSGTVNSYAKRIAAEDAAHRTPGVLDVVNDIKVHAAGHLARTDTEIAHAVRQALEADVFVPADRIETTISSGWVTLAGEVDYFLQREDAERAIVRLHGVRGVINTVTVAPRLVHQDEVREAIEQALERRAEREADRITVIAAEGTVTLRGVVDTWLEKRAVLGAAGHAPGVRHVVDEIRVDPYR